MLSIELLKRIFAHLDTQELLKLRLVSKAFCAVATASIVALTLTMRFEFKVPEIRNFLSQCGGLQKLKLDLDISSDRYMFYWFQDVVRQLEPLPYVRELQVTGMAPCIWPEVTTLRVTSFRKWSVQCEHAMSLLLRWPSLTLLDLTVTLEQGSEWIGMDLEAKQPRLKQLSLRTIGFDNLRLMQSLRDFLQQCPYPHLRELSFVPENAPEDSFSVENYPELTALTCLPSFLAGQVKPVESIKQVHLLNVKGESVIAKVVAVCPNVEHIRLTQGDQLFTLNRPMDGLLAHHLQSCDLTEFADMTLDEFEYLADTSVETLAMNCAHVPIELCRVVMDMISERFSHLRCLKVVNASSHSREFGRMHPFLADRCVSLTINSDSEDAFDIPKVLNEMEQMDVNANTAIRMMHAPKLTHLTVRGTLATKHGLQKFVKVVKGCPLLRELKAGAQVLDVVKRAKLKVYGLHLEMLKVL